MGATPCFDKYLFTDSRSRLAATGHNSGNQLIAHGLLKQLNYSHIEWDYNKGWEYVDNNFDFIVIAAANFLFEKFDFSGMADFISNTKLPVLIAGLGAQAPDNSDPRIDLQPGTVRLMKVVAERANLIGVRGDFTAQVLYNLGINNVQIIGCPSYYMSGKNGFSINIKGLNADSPVAVHASRDVIGHSYNKDLMRKTVAKLYDESAKRDGIFVAQTEIEEISLADTSNEIDSFNDQSRLREILESFGSTFVNDFWLKRGMRVFWDVDNWIKELSKYPFAIGTRFHGTMAAIQGGTPAVCVTHDSRTKEMCEFLSIPSVVMDTFISKSIEYLYESADHEAMKARYEVLYPQYREFLSLNGF